MIESILISIRSLRNNVNITQTLKEIAESKDTSGMEGYAVIKKPESIPEAMKPGTVWTPEKIEETFAGAV